MNAHTMLGRILGATLLCAAGATISGCEVSAYPDNTYVDGDYPPADYIATVEPVYFEGHAAYWYGNRWYYRDGARWGHYDREPPGLVGYRGRFTARGRVNYGRGGGGFRGGRR
jgi:hypothetical protein